MMVMKTFMIKVAVEAAVGRLKGTKAEKVVVGGGGGRDIVK